MKKELDKYGQYKSDIFRKLNFKFATGKKMLDLGCGDGRDSEIFINVYKLNVYGLDIYEHPNIKNNKNLKFSLGSIYKIPFENETFDYVYLHDVLHHIDEAKQSRQKHIDGLLELKRVTKKDGIIIIIEGNRYNPLFYPHMVKMLGHNHFKQSYFIGLIQQVFVGAKFKHFESHFYPQKFLWFWKSYETFMEKFSPKPLLAYNVAIIKKR